MKFKRRFFWSLVVILIYSALAVTSVSAHALLVRSNPEANAVLQQAPVQVELFFSETLEPTLSSITVIDSNNRTVDAGDARVDPSDPRRMTVTLHALADGVYTVSWKALSTIDGHQTVGTFPFAVGDAIAAAVQAIPQSTTARLPFSALLSKFLLLVSLTILIGQRLFIWLIWSPALKANQNPSRAIDKPGIWATLYRFGLVGVLLSIGIGMLAQAGQTTGRELSFPWYPETSRILAETRLGVVWLARLSLAMFGVWLAWSKESLLKIWIGFIVNLALLFTVTLTSHAATEVRPLLPMLGDWLHLIGMTFWLGGLVYLFTGIRHIQQSEDVQRSRAKLISFLTSRFSIHAVLFVSLIGLTGFYSAYLRVGAWSSLLTSLYGHALLIKQIFVAGLLAIAATNLLVISPRLKRDSTQGIAESSIVARFGKILILELTFAGLLLANVSFLTYIPPAKVVSFNTDLRSRTSVDDLRMDITISPGRVGQNTFTLKLSTSEGQPVQSAKEVLLRFTPNQGNIPPSELELIGLGDGTFTAKGAYLSLPGSWQVQAVVRREDKFDAYANFDFTLRSPGSAEGSSTIPRQAAWLILLIALLCSSLTASIKAHPALRLGIGAPLALLMLGLGIFYLRLPVSVASVANPIPPNSESVAAGQTLFSTHCASCHGVAGKGDGPIGLTLNPRPADLTQHAIPGVHADSQLYEWITNGFPGSRMPAFKTALSDTDRWHLVNFIRTFAPK
ncbi:MAG: copper resistance protein CopC [Anaerolineae bacterium]|nr:copper resistance protein CopC [Anaerolineae bacterium]MCI0608639.1 copper resistance protein CopC [Anaerolineae bacterium]